MISHLATACHDIFKTFDGVQALRGVSVQFSGPAVIGVIGPNGAGKTTMLDVLTGFTVPDRGRCTIGRQDVTGLAPNRVASLGMVRSFQEMRLVHDISVLDNVMLATPGHYGESFLGAIVDRVRLRADEERRGVEAFELLCWAGLAEHDASLAATLSYGQQKLLSLCCCLATKARILLLDEPVAGVHPNMVGVILGLLQSLVDRGYLVVFVEHNLEAVRELAERVVVMDSGEVVADGPTGDVLSSRQVVDAYLR